MDPTLNAVLEQNAELRVQLANLRAGVNQLFARVGEALGTTFDEAATGEDMVAAIRRRLEAPDNKPTPADAPTPIEGKKRA